MFDLNRLSKNITSINESVVTLDDSFTNGDLLDHSFFMEAVDFITNIDNQVLAGNKSFYKSLCESEGNQILINESFSDWVQTIKDIVKKVIDFIKALINKLIVGLNMLVKREKYLKDHEKDFSKFNENHKFHMNCFNFTIDNVDCPPTSMLDMLTNNGLAGNYSLDSAYDIMEKKDPKIDKAKELGKLYDDYMDSISDGYYYDIVRGECLRPGSGEKVDSADYSKELFEIFRDGQSSKEDKEITSSEVSSSLTRFKNYEHIKKDLEKKKKEIEKKYNEVIKDIEKSSKVVGNKITYKNYNKKSNDIEYEGDAASKLDLFIKAKANELHEVSNIHTIAFSARLDAYKDQFKQDKTILYKALYRILGNIRTGVREDAIEEMKLGKIGKAALGVGAAASIALGAHKHLEKNDPSYKGPAHAVHQMVDGAKRYKENFDKEYEKQKKNQENNDGSPFSYAGAALGSAVAGGAAKKRKK